MGERAYGIVQLSQPTELASIVSETVCGYVYSPIHGMFIPASDAIGHIEAYATPNPMADRGWRRPFAKLQKRLASMLGDEQVMLVMSTQLDYAKERERGQRSQRRVRVEGSLFVEHDKRPRSGPGFVKGRGVR